AAIGDPRTAVVNALTASRHRGEGGVHYGRPGRIAGSVNVPADRLVDAETKVFLPAGDLASMFADTGADRADKVITYCGAGITAVASAGLAGCMSQDYLRGLGRHATKGAFDAMGEGLPSIEEPLRQTLRRTLVEDDTLRHAARDMSETAVKSLEAGLASPDLR